MKKSVLASCFMALAVIPVSAHASVITGVLNFEGTVDVSLGSIVFEGSSFTIDPSSGGFAALNGTTGTIQNITNPPDATGTLTTPVTDFMTFSAAPNISVTFTYLAPGIYPSTECSLPAAGGQVCTPTIPAESPYNLVNITSTSSFASFQLKGWEVDSLTGQTIPIIATFAQPFTTQSFQELLATVEGGGTITTSFAGQLSAVVPEPGSLAGLMLLMGTGLGVIYRRKMKKG